MPKNKGWNFMKVFCSEGCGRGRARHWADRHWVVSLDANMFARYTCPKCQYEKEKPK